MEVFMDKLFFGAMMLLAVLLLAQFCAYFADRSRTVKKCTARTTGIIKDIFSDYSKDSDTLNLTVECVVDGVTYVKRMGDTLTYGVSEDHKAGMELTIWYDPANPKRIMVTEDPKDLMDINGFWKKLKPICWIGIALCMITMLLAKKLG